MARPARAAAGAGIAAAVFGAGLGELVAAVVAPSASPFAAVGSAAIDLAPTWAKDAAIGLFGTLDKLALLVGIGLVLLIVSAAVGLLEAAAPPWGRIAMLALGGIGVAAAVTRADAPAAAWVPAAVAGTASAIVVGALINLIRPVGAAAARAGETTASTPAIATASTPAGTPASTTTPAATASTAAGDAASPSRRTFLAWAGGTAAVGILAAIAGNLARVGARTVEAVRTALRLPAPARAAAPVPASAELDLAVLAPVVTPNAQFYRIDTALIVPQVDPAEWSLRIHGMVEREVTITWDELLALPLEESFTTLACVSNPVGGDLIGNARWLGYPIRELLARAVPTPDADMVLSRSIDGFTASTPLEVLTDDRDAILAVGMNGEPLPVEHGFPVRMVVPGLYGYVSATKWVTELEVTRFDRARAYWTDRGWSERGPIKLQSRIDVPRGQVDAGDTVIAGVAWHQHVGVSGVEVQLDDGPWRAAELATAISDDTWVQWRMPWTATAGAHTIRCRATSADGRVQTSDVAPPAPDGATGWHEVVVTVA